MHNKSQKCKENLIECKEGLIIKLRSECCNALIKRKKSGYKYCAVCKCLLRVK